MPAPTPEQRAAAQAFFQGKITPSPAAARDALLNLYADGYASGALAAAQQIPGAALVAGLSGVYGDSTSAWAAWEPGNVDAAQMLSDGGFASLLEDADLTIKGITGTALDRMGSLLAEGALNGDSVDTIARTLSDLLADPQRAYTIANTELARATGLASHDAYREAGVTNWEWVLSPGACDLCEEQQSLNPHPMNDEPPPAHPSCRCASAPLDPGPATTDDAAVDPEMAATAPAAPQEDAE